ncbi:unnamed protein product [Didymodactylos carnosus]|uniref:Uncharacterized protein n=1 Tax=Didymodactylos carnosus TaxID=1234261 RepID=A0A815WZS6_9BILA|nr:unnamed protein product [Didymodactylos carnosus]CAF1550072.1 unnamed protein product [Didymodactylos carnosus]CAF4245301.1 unnamed protein product [Didymodactylos carnosus]CAF4411040.1 unnamed protein product [Didymodactylos carnosus]
MNVSESGLLAVAKSVGDISAYGSSLYSSGIHQISIEIVKVRHWTFFGIISSSDQRWKSAPSLPSAYGWCGGNKECAFVLLNRAPNKGYGGFDGDIIDNDRLELTIPIDVKRCSLPWAFAVDLGYPGNSVRIL